jgi:hypothetical protein
MVAKLRIKSTNRACDFIPRRPCMDTLYFPWYVRDPEPPIEGRNEVLYSLGGHIDGGFNLQLSSFERFVDKILYSHRLPDGTWSNPEFIITKSFFTWMQDDEFLAANLDTFIGCTASPTVVKIDGLYHMAFCATVSDPNCTTAGHGGTGENAYGSCVVPWSYFIVYWATSEDGANWTLVDMQRQNRNIALQHAAVYYEPTPADIGFDKPGQIGEFQGAHHVSILHEPDDGFIYLTIEFWTVVGDKNGLLRTPVGAIGQFEIWDGPNNARWVPLEDGRLPEWFNTDRWRGNPFAHIISGIAHTSLAPGFKYILTAQGAGVDHGKRGMNNCIEVAFSKGDLTRWEGLDVVDTAIPTLDGSGADNIVLNPVYCEDGKGSYFFLFATNDDDADGVPGCDGDPYPGLAIYQGKPVAPKKKRAARRLPPSE